MTKSTLMRIRLHSVVTFSVVSVVVALSPFLSGCGGGGGAAPAVANPGGGGGTNSTNTQFSITNASITPARFSRFVGGPATIRVDVTAVAGVANVVARILRPIDGRRLDDLALALQAGSTYQAAASIPSNLRIDGQSEVYTVTLAVTDATGAQRIDSIGTIEVPSPLGDPNTPGGVPPPPALSRGVR